MAEFENIREAFDDLVNKKWDSLSLEQRKELRNAKRDFNHKAISEKRMREILEKYGTIKVRIVFTLKQ